MKIINILIIFFCVACTSQKHNSNMSYAQQPTIVYKTKKNYDNLVPILLSDDKTEIVMYPAPTDLYYQGKLALPTNLKQGYLLDNRGISKNTAFLKLTYQEYVKLEKVPTLSEFYDMILDKDPILELYNCGNRANYQSIVKELNKLIEDEKLIEFKK